ncbi:MAG: dienelactone hydrolase family protein [Planctomycetes bacterium]|nr:dienelactone hydrolase family protein [Planctomycetota bacterium]
MKTTFRLAAACALTLAAAAAVAVAAPGPAKPAAAPAPADRAQLLTRFDYAPGSFDFTKKRELQFLTFDQYRVEMPSPVVTPVASNNTIYGFYYKPRLPTDAAVIVLPIAAGRDLSLEQSVAIYLAHRGFKAFVMPMPYQHERGRDVGTKDVLKLNGGVEALSNGLCQAVLDVKRVRQWLTEKERVHPGRVGVIGISLGSLAASIAYSVDPGFRAAALVLSGGDMADVIWHGSKEVERIKRDLIAQGKDEAWLRAAVRPMDPLTYATRERRAGVLMVNAEADEVIPIADSRKLRKAYGNPRMMVLPGDHYSVAVYLPVILETVARHFRSRLLGPLPPAEAPAALPAPATAPATERPAERPRDPAQGRELFP